MNLAQLLILVLPFLVMWWFLIRPQRQRMAQHRQLMDNVGEGDDIVTTGGLYGSVVDSDAESLYVEIADGVEIRLSRGAVAQLIELDGDDDDEFDTDDDDFDEAGDDEIDPDESVADELDPDETVADETGDDETLADTAEPGSEDES